MKVRSLVLAATAAAVLSIAGACGSSKVRHIDYTHPDGTIRLISYNIRQSGMAEKDGPDAWDKRKDATLNMIEREVPSVFGLQEALPDQIAYIDKAFPQYKHVGVGRDDGKEGGEVMAIYWFDEAFELEDHGTYWLSETPQEVSRGWDAACNRTLTWVKLKEKSTGRSFFYFNTHLDHLGEIARAESVKLIVKIISDIVPAGESVLVSGDLNADISNPIFAPFKDFGFIPARDAAPATSHVGTFNAFGSAPSGIILNHILIRNAKPLSFRTLTENYGAAYISDHYPIALDFEL